LKPAKSTLRSLSKVAPSPKIFAQRQSRVRNPNEPILLQLPRCEGIGDKNLWRVV
jgi:hypothetical protein